ncbi:hypothetical protein [Methylobacterium gnaphalii]
MRLDDGVAERIDALLEPKQSRADFIRKAVREAVEREEAERQKVSSQGG